MIRRLGERALDCLFPPTCVLCAAPGQPGLDLCRGCLEDLPLNDHACPRCALPLPADRPGAALCGQCLRHPPPFDTAHTAFLYLDPLPSMVAGAKFRARLNLARVLGICLARSLRLKEAVLPEVIIPVPLHPRRARARGYNQAVEIARAVASELGVAVDADLCARTGSVTPQEGLERAARRRNVRGAFAVKGSPTARRVAVLDDVVTTGSTAAELTRVLRRAGTARVDLWAVARTP